MTIQYLT